MDIRQLRYFVRIVDCGSLSAAARELHIAQPALSQQLAKLEAEVGLPLLSRSSRGVAPTGNGKALYDHGRFMLRQFDQALEIARGGSGPISGVVTLGMPATTVAAIGLGLIQKVRDRYPQVQLKISEGMSGHVVQMARLGQLDLAIAFNEEDRGVMDAEPLMVEELFLIVGRSNPMIAPDRQTVSLAEVSSLPLILPTRDHGLRQRVDAELSSRGLPMNLAAQIDSLALVMDCVQAGMGATIKPMGAIMKRPDPDRSFRWLAFEEAVFHRPNYLWSRPEEQMHAAARVVRQEILESVKSLVESPTWRGFLSPNFIIEKQPAE